MTAFRLAGAALFAGAITAQAQSWRTLDVSRQLRDSSSHHVRIQYGAGKLDVRSTADPVLYAMRLRYDEEAGQPVHRYDASSHALVLGMSNQSVHVGRSNKSGEMRLALSRVVPVALDVDVGAAEVRMDLGGLAVNDLRLNTGASETHIDFSTPNAATLRAIDLDLGAASVEVENLGNANTAELRAHGGVGSLTLDFGGRLTQDMAVDVGMALGKLTLRIPRDVAVRLDVERFLAGLDTEGMEKRGNAWYSTNWDTAAHKLRIHANTTFGSLSVELTP